MSIDRSIFLVHRASRLLFTRSIATSERDISPPRRFGCPFRLIATLRSARAYNTTVGACSCSLGSARVRRRVTSKRHAYTGTQADMQAHEKSVRKPGVLAWSS